MVVVIFIIKLKAQMRYLTVMFFALLTPVLAIAATNSSSKDAFEPVISDQPPVFFSNRPTGAVSSQNANVVNKPPHFDTLSEKQFESASDLHEVTTCDKYLGYRIRMPIGWRRVQSASKFACSNSNGGFIAKYAATETKKNESFLDIETQKFDNQYPLWTQVLNRTKSCGELKNLQLLGFSIISATRFELMFSYVRTNGTPSIVRTMAVTNGPRIMLASYEVPNKKLKKEQAMQEKVVSSFRAIMPKKSGDETKN